MEKKLSVDNVVVQEEHVDDILKKDGVARDYSGAVLVQDPVERKLVKKLDMRIMVSHHHMSFHFKLC